MSSFIRCIIHHMVEFAKHWGPAFLVASVASIGLTLQSYIYLKIILITLVLLIISMILFIFTVIALYYDLRDAYRKDHRLYRGN